MAVKFKARAVKTLLVLGPLLFLIGAAIAFYSGFSHDSTYDWFAGPAILIGTLMMNVGAWWGLSTKKPTRH